MRKFNYVQELEEWLNALTYEQFWHEMAPLGAGPQTREDVDQQIADGIVDQDTVLACLKGAARLDLIKEMKLEYRDDMPWLLNEHSYF